MNKSARVIIVHGTEGSPDINWFPWLRQRLDSNCMTCISPQFPTPENQSLSTWLSTLNKNVGKLRDSDILIGHSTGVALILNVLNGIEHPVQATFLVGGFVGELGISKYDKLNQSFFEKPFDWLRIRANAGRLFIYNGDNDPYVPLHKGQELASLLDTELSIISGGGHINAESGYTKFERLYNDLAAV